MLKKAILLIVAVGALTALAAPASAVAQWSHSTVPISDNTMELTGHFKFNSVALGAIDCETAMEITLEPGTTGKINNWDVDLDEAGSTVTSKCVASGFLAGCIVHKVERTGLPLTIHTDTSKITITSGEIHHSLTGTFCPVTTVTLTAGTVTATPDNLHAATKLTLGGTMVAHNPIPSTGNVTISGTQTILGADSGHYGIT